MHDEHLHERLSAYLDGEVTEDERAAVESELEASDEARATLEEFGRLSALVAGLPVQAAPADLWPAVRAQIAARGDGHTEPATKSAAPVPASTPATVGANRSPGVAGIVGIVATLVCTIVIAVVLGPRESDPGPRDLAATAPGGEPGAAPVATTMSNATVDAASAGVVAEAELDLAGRRGERVAGLVAPPALETSVADDRSKLFVFKEKDLAQAEDFVEPVEASWRNLEVGDVVPFVDRSGERVAVIEVTVVDVHEAFGEVQLLLQRNAVRQLGEIVEEDRSSLDHRRNASANALEQLEQDVAKKGKTGSDTFAVYVSTTPRQLASTLEELRANRNVVALEGPVATGLQRANGRHGKGAPSLVKNGDERNGNERNVADDPSPAAAEPGDPATARPGEGQRTVPAEVPAGALAAMRATEGNSYQVLRRYGDKDAKQELVRLRDRLAAGGDDDDEDRLLRPQAVQRFSRETAEEESVRVLILLRPSTR